MGTTSMLATAPLGGTAQASSLDSHGLMQELQLRPLGVSEVSQPAARLAQGTPVRRRLCKRALQQELIWQQVHEGTRRGRVQGCLGGGMLGWLLLASPLSLWLSRQFSSRGGQGCGVALRDPTWFRCW